MPESVSRYFFLKSVLDHHQIVANLLYPRSCWLVTQPLSLQLNYAGTRYSLPKYRFHAEQGFQSLVFSGCYLSQKEEKE